MFTSRIYPTQNRGATIITTRLRCFISNHVVYVFVSSKGCVVFYERASAVVVANGVGGEGERVVKCRVIYGCPLSTTQGVCVSPCHVIRVRVFLAKPSVRSVDVSVHTRTR
jgi:hypothetical protein